MTVLVVRVAAALRAPIAKSGGRPCALGLFRSVALVVHLMRRNPVQDAAGAVFGVSQSTLSRRWDLLRPVIGRVLRAFVPGAPQLAGAFGTVIVDGTLCPTWDWRHIPDLYSAKAGYAGMNVQVAATLDGRIAAIGPHALHGARHDAHAYAASGLADQLAGLHQIADLGYVGAGGIDLVPYKRPPGQELSEHDAAFNRAFSSIRAAGEHANARLKTWRMLSEEGGRYRAPLDKYDEMLAAIIGLHNYRISTDENGPLNNPPGIASPEITHVSGRRYGALSFQRLARVARSDGDSERQANQGGSLMVATMAAIYDAVADAASAPLRPAPVAGAAGQGGGRGDAVRCGAVEAITVRIDARDPISEAGVRTQLRSRPEIRVAGPEQSAAVVVAVADVVDEETTRWLRGVHRAGGLPVVLVSGRVDGRALSALVEAGVRGVLRRPEATADRLVSAVRAAAAGHGDLPPELLRQLLDHLAGLNRQVLGPRGYSFTGLTERESTVLRLLADGLSTREVAVRLSYSERTIKTVIQDLTLRLQLRNRTQAVAYALRNGWI